MKRLIGALMAVGLVAAAPVQRSEAVPATFTAPAIAAPAVASPLVQAVQLTLRHDGYSIAVDGLSGPQTARVVTAWQKANGLDQNGTIDLRTIASLGLGGATAQAERTTTPSAPSQGIVPAGLDACGTMAFYRAQAGLPAVFDAIGYRESRCTNTPTSNTGCCVGYLQLNVGNFTAPGYRDGIAACGVARRSDIMGENDEARRKQMCVAKVLYTVSGMQPWAL